MNRMLKKTKLKFLCIFGGVALVSIATLATILPGITYKYNYDRYIATNSEQVFEISNNYNKNSRGTQTEPSLDANYFGIANSSSVTDPKPNDAINFGSIYRAGKDKSVYGSTLAASMIDVSNEAMLTGINYFGVSSALYEYVRYRGQEDSSKSLYRDNSGFVTYPILPEDKYSYHWNTISVQDDPASLEYGISFKNTLYAHDVIQTQYGGMRDISGVGGTWKYNVGGGVSGFKTYDDYYKTNNMSVDFPLTGLKAFDIYGNELSEFSLFPDKSSVEYYNQTPSGIQFNYSYLPKKWYFLDASTGQRTTVTPSTGREEGYLAQQDWIFDNYLSSDSNANASRIHAASITIATQDRNSAASVFDDRQYATIGLNKYTPSRAQYQAVLNGVFTDGTSRSDIYPAVGNKWSNIPSDSKRTKHTSGSNFGTYSIANATIALTPIEYNYKYWYIPLIYSGTTKYSIFANVENEDKGYTPIEYVTKRLYEKGSQNDNVEGSFVDDTADFNVNFIANAYPGCEYGSINRLYVNNVAGTVRWEYNPGTVLEKGLIRQATEDDVKSVTIGGFKRIPGITKIADSINVQSPYTLAEDTAKDNYRVYKLIYDLAITNLPSPNDYLGEDWAPNTYTNLQQIMRVTNITYNNIGDKTETGYEEGGYVEADVSLMLYYDQATNLVTPSSNFPSTPKRIRLYGFKHVEPTLVPNKDIYFGDETITASQALDTMYIDSLKQSIMNGLQTPVEPTFENDFRTTEGGTLPVTSDVPDFTKQISIINSSANNLEGTVTVTVVLNAYFGGQDASPYPGSLLTSGFPPSTITITGYKRVQETKLNSPITIETDRTAIDALQVATSSTGNTYPYLQYLLNKYRNEAFVGLPESFNASSIVIEGTPIADNINGTVTAQVAVKTYYTSSGELVDLTTNVNASYGTKSLGLITINGFKKVLPTSIKNNTISVIDNLEFYNTLASQVDDSKIQSLIFDNRDTIFTSYPGLYFSVNSINVINKTVDNLTGTISVQIALSRYYNNKGEYINADDDPETWLRLETKINIIGLTQVKPTSFVEINFNEAFQPTSANSTLTNSTYSTTTLVDFKQFLLDKNLFGVTSLDDDSSTSYQVTKTGGTLSLTSVEKSAWSILQLSSKTVFQVTPTDIASFVIRVLQYAGMQNSGINIKSSDVAVNITSSRDPNTVINTSNKALYEDKDWYTGSLTAEISIQLADAIWTKTIDFVGTANKNENIFNRYIPIPSFVSSSGNDAERNLATSFDETQIEAFIYQNIDQILNGSFNAKVPSGKPINFSSFNISLSNILYNNNKGEVSVLLTIDNFYLPSGNLSIDPNPAIDGDNPPTTMSTTITFSGFKQQKSTALATEINLKDAGAIIPITIYNEDGKYTINPTDPNNAIVVNNWKDITAEGFWNALPLASENTDEYSKNQFIYELIMGTGALWGDPTEPSNNRILLSNAEIPANFSPSDIVEIDDQNPIISNINGRITINFSIKNYYDLYGNLETELPKNCEVTIYGFKQTLASEISNSTISTENINEKTIYIEGKYETTASLVTPDYIINNILSLTSGLWPQQTLLVDEGSDSTNSTTGQSTSIDLIPYIQDLKIVAANNSSGVVKATFFLKEDLNIYDANGNLKTLEKGTYTLVISGFESSLLLYVGIAIIIVFVLLVLIPAIIIIVKKARVKSAAKGKISDLI